MLKIKDSVDLKELKKFGFKIEDETDMLDGKPTRLVSNNIEIELYDDIYDKWNSRKIYALTSGYLDTLYDLIQAGLVVKVEDEY